MDVCYNKLLKLLIDKRIKKTELRKMTGISPNTLTKLSNNEFVSMEVLVKICRALNCDIGDIVEVVQSPDNNAALSSSKTILEQ
ncbi:helix-turn-helix transcriptional regulator [Sporomusa sp. KB1]|jgi:DNA-binding Xre family transcriptional regulator|uniref:helix-turn-helix domain-containing protein n=1 Tax=Sporomusa sp. KB1 TaxID=943346 RepID=UPI0011A2854E|nr:helix-turn-helix transcriptional regulator [Sporomusa sp. KB1]TWH49500.1 DNA-binding Xre family transcriptional regulator [Sporomusa sp. KB1]